jgi:lysophospholipase L1-like esterase
MPDTKVFGESSSSNIDRPRRIICYGDSNTVGYYNKGAFFQPYAQTLSSDLSAAGWSHEVAVCGLCSYTTQDMLNEKDSEQIHPPIGPSGRGLQRILDEDVHTDLVIIMTGTNDIGMSTKPETIVRHVAQLHAICHKRGIQTVAIAPTQSVRRSARRIRQRLADLLAAWAKSTPGVIDFLDIEDLLPRPCGKDGSANMPNSAMA